MPLHDEINCQSVHAVIFKGNIGECPEYMKKLLIRNADVL